MRIEHPSSNAVLCAVHLAAFDPALLAAWTRVSYDSHVPNLKPCGPCSFQQEICGVFCIIRHLHHLLRSDMVCQCLRKSPSVLSCHRRKCLGYRSPLLKETGDHQAIHKKNNVKQSEPIWNNMKQYESIWNNVKQYETKWNTMK